MKTVLAIFIGGGLGSIARYGVSSATIVYLRSIFPWGTLIVNIASCIVMAIVLGFFSTRPDASNAVRSMLLIGFCGGFSTFSTFSYETLALMRTGHSVIALANIIISIGVCMAILYFWNRNL